jgi:hypothetical protein
VVALWFKHRHIASLLFYQYRQNRAHHHFRKAVLNNRQNRVAATISRKETTQSSHSQKACHAQQSCPNPRSCTAEKGHHNHTTRPNHTTPGRHSPGWPRNARPLSSLSGGRAAMQARFLQVGAPLASFRLAFSRRLRRRRCGAEIPHHSTVTTASHRSLPHTPVPNPGHHGPRFAAARRPPGRAELAGSRCEPGAAKGKTEGFAACYYSCLSLQAWSVRSVFLRLQRAASPPPRRSRSTSPRVAFRARELLPAHGARHPCLR